MYLEIPTSVSSAVFIPWSKVRHFIESDKPFWPSYIFRSHHMVLGLTLIKLIRRFQDSLFFVGRVISSCCKPLRSIHIDNYALISLLGAGMYSLNEQTLLTHSRKTSVLTYLCLCCVLKIIMHSTNNYTNKSHPCIVYFYCNSYLNSTLLN